MGDNKEKPRFTIKVWKILKEEHDITMSNLEEKLGKDMLDTAQKMLKTAYIYGNKKTEEETEELVNDFTFDELNSLLSN